jgi:molybdopterin-containing oxidoreductase family iron-sulfur binding subunit
MLFGDLNDPASRIRAALGAQFSIQRKPELGTQPEIFYLV